MNASPCWHSCPDARSSSVSCFPEDHVASQSVVKQGHRYRRNLPSPAEQGPVSRSGPCCSMPLARRSMPTRFIGRGPQKFSEADFELRPAKESLAGGACKAKRQARQLAAFLKPQVAPRQPYLLGPALHPSSLRRTSCTPGVRISGICGGICGSVWGGRGSWWEGLSLSLQMASATPTRRPC